MLIDSLNKQWNKIDINHTIANASTSFSKIGTYPELINCKELIIQIFNYQFYSINTGDNLSVIYYSKTTSSGASESQVNMTVDFATGQVEGRQSIKGSSANSAIIKAIYYR